ncbi:hypothetical protein [Enterococcus raffinosus]
MEFIIDEGNQGEKYANLSLDEIKQLVLKNIDASVVSIEMKKLPSKETGATDDSDYSN